MGYTLGAEVTKAPQREYGKTDMEVDTDHILFKNVSKETTSWMSHTYFVSTPPEGFVVTAKTDTCPVAAMANEEKNSMVFNSIRK